MDALPKNHFRLPIEVTKADIDGLNHVNNIVYLKWMIQAASDIPSHWFHF